MSVVRAKAKGRPERRKADSPRARAAGEIASDEGRVGTAVEKPMATAAVDRGSALVCAGGGAAKGAVPICCVAASCEYNMAVYLLRECQFRLITNGLALRGRRVSWRKSCFL